MKIRFASSRGRRTGAPLAIAAACALAAACGPTRAANPGYTVLREFPHDPTAYTQGLLIADGWLYESTGRYGLSDLRRVELETGRVDARHALSAELFGEGLALLDGRLYQLTWKAGVGYVYDVATLAPIDSFTYEGEGWGLTTDGTHLIKSNGTSALDFLDPQTFEVVRQVLVQENGSELNQLNELEYVDGELFANVFQSNWIVRVDVETGDVLQWLDMAAIVPPETRGSSEEVLNGIALSEDGTTLFVTGKLWPTLFEIRLQPDSIASAAGMGG